MGSGLKDAFFRWWDKVDIFVYHKAIRFTYYVIEKRKCKDCKPISKEKKKEIRNYWKKVAGKRISTIEYNWYRSKGVEVVPQLIPDTIWHRYVEPHFNSLLMLKGFNDKNYFQKIIGEKNSPETLCHCISGQLLDSNYLPMNEAAVADLIRAEGEAICKPSIESGGGRDICFIKKEEASAEKIKSLTGQYKGNFIIQKILRQHGDLNKLNPDSLNTIRIASFLYKGKVHILSGLIRVAKKGSRLDNISSGGYYFPIDGEGRLGNVIIDKDSSTSDRSVHKKNPNDKRFEFSGKTVPSWNEIIETVRNCHYKLPHFKIINWDVAVREDGTPIIIEYNLIDSSASLHQLYTKPIFGSLTDEVLKEVFGR